MWIDEVGRARIVTLSEASASSAVRTGTPMLPDA